MRNLLLAVVLIGCCISCTESEEGLIGEWEGTVERVSSSGKPVESDISCTIKSISGVDRSVALTIAGIKYEFEATEEMDMLLYNDEPLGKDSSVMSYISGSAELLYDTLLHFDHEIYSVQNGTIHNADRYMFNMIRK